uniref:Uncharacterized protein n=1 Tax=Oscillatoriales cyanobacterium SpSt-418 TaxID=2282169 RepID=A0A7C3PG16_9CYAN
MWQGFIGRQIRRSDRNILLTNMGLVLIPLTFGVLSSRYWQNFAAGPLKLDRQAALAVKDPTQEARDFVTIKGDRALDTGVEQITQRKRRYSGTVTSETTSAKYIALLMDRKILIVKSRPETAQNTEFTGSLQPISSSIQSRIIDAAARQNPELRTAFLPYMLQEEDYRTPGYIGLAIALPLIALGSWNVSKVLKRRNNPTQHPIAKALAVAGEPEVVAARVEQELQSDAGKQEILKTTLTRSWLFRPTYFGMDTVPLDQLTWIYKKVTTRRSYGIPVGKTYSAVVCDRSGKTIEIPGKEKQIDELLTSLCERAPWVVAGFSDELNQMWNRERTQFVEGVDLRRQQAQS